MRAGFQIHFGNAIGGVFIESLPRGIDAKALTKIDPFIVPAQKMHLTGLSFLHQIHAATGKDVVPKASPVNFVDTGDYLITAMQGIGLGILTADCLPVLCVDITHNVVGIAHVGWRGAAAGVHLEMIREMSMLYGTKFHEVRLIFGPSALSCCYQVNESFITEMHGVNPYAQECATTITPSGSIQFDLPTFVKETAMVSGVKSALINRLHNRCTICNDEFFSYRRQGAQAGRQMSIISLSSSSMR